METYSPAWWAIVIVGGVLLGLFGSVIAGAIIGLFLAWATCAVIEVVLDAIFGDPG